MLVNNHGNFHVLTIILQGDMTREKKLHFEILKSERQIWYPETKVIHGKMLKVIKKNLGP